ncbi:LysR family transcriptional regulator [Labrys monachus]|uniref:DNA-binding transcriptional LysR family regulator n=1 Tax=Labrys monachus TaxID=217067 RepID=A0ABU0F7X6_9HYPH|nr:LysR family transcriptional regulator [Labrys monachus]MDQ0390712.1 DNA-binding transcriptional LysR family regulator [Labrys monachus]
MRGSDYAELAAFVAVVEKRSFARAAKHLRIAPSSLSQTVKKLEERLGVQLLHRTTRSVAMTGAGVRLFNKFKPAMDEMEAAVVDLHELSAQPSGLVRLHVPRPAYTSLLEMRLGELNRVYPDIHLDIVVDDAIIDIVRSGFDLDIRLTEAVDPSTCALPVGNPVRHVVVASPDYLARHGRPATPSDLLRHRCIQWRQPNTEHPYRWAFQIDGCTTLVDVAGPLTVSHCDIAVNAARQSIGIAFVLEPNAMAYQGELEFLLTEYLPVFPGWSVCYPRHSRLSVATQTIVDMLERDAFGSNGDRHSGAAEKRARQYP